MVSGSKPCAAGYDPYGLPMTGGWIPWTLSTLKPHVLSSQNQNQNVNFLWQRFAMPTHVKSYCFCVKGASFLDPRAATVVFRIQPAHGSVVGQGHGGHGIRSYQRMADDKSWYNANQ